MLPSDRIDAWMEDEEDGLPLYEMDPIEARGQIEAFLSEAIMAVGAPTLHRMVDEADQCVKAEVN